MTLKLSHNNIIRYLMNLGLCRKQNIDLVKVICQPSIVSTKLIVFFPSSHQLVIRQNSKISNKKNENYIRNEFEIHRFLNHYHELTHTTSLRYNIVHFDKSNSIIIYKLPNGHTTIENYYRRKKSFPIEISKLLGVTLATLHQETFNSKCCKKHFNAVTQGEYQYVFPHPKQMLEKPTPESLNGDLPPEGLKFLALYQNSKNLTYAVNKLVASHKRYCLTLNNFKLDNIAIPMNSQPKSLISKKANSVIKIVNWDSCSWGDPAFDLGTTISSYLLIWLYSIPVQSNFNLEESLKLASVPFQVIQPLINSFVCSYLDEFSVISKDYPDFLIRVIQFTGLSLIYSIVSRIQNFGNFDYQCIYILQIAKNLLCNPKNSVKSILGVVEFDLAS